MSDNRVINANRHQELDSLLDEFIDDEIIQNPSKIKFIVVSGNITVTAIIPMKEGTGKSRLHPIMYIMGNLTRIERQSWTLISSELVSYLQIKDFLPPPFCKKIVYIRDWGENFMKGAAFSEVGRNVWTIDDPTKLPIKNTMKCTARIIIANIISDLKEM